MQSASRLILVEGLPGSGKTGTARHLAEQLALRGVSAVAFAESDPNNPISIGPILPDLSGAVARYAERLDFLDDWQRLAERAHSQDRTLVIEARLIQRAAMFLVLAGGSAEDARRHTARIVERIRDLEPVLIYLRASQPERHAERALDESPPDWVKLALAEFDRTSWFVGRSLRGREGWLEFFRYWGPELDRIIGSLEIQVLRLTDPNRDWEAALDRALAAVLKSS